MARNDGIDRTSARNVDVPDKDIGNTQKHNEREKDSYRNPDIIPERLSYNVHFKKASASYTELFAQMESSGTISTRGLKPDAIHYGELIFDVNSAYFHNHGGYEFAKQFYAEAYQAAVKIVGGEQYILSAVLAKAENSRLEAKLQSAQKSAAVWKQRYESLKEQARPYLEAVKLAPEKVRAFLNAILTQTRETKQHDQSVRRKSQDMEL